MKTIALTCIVFSIALLAKAQDGNPQKDPNIAVFQTGALQQQLETTKSPWLPFFKGKNLLSGIYQLKAGAIDKQTPHATDEMYYIISGEGKFKADDQEINVSTGTILFVKANITHQFFDITEDLNVLVFFDK